MRWTYKTPHSLVAEVDEERYKSTVTWRTLYAQMSRRGGVKWMGNAFGDHMSRRFAFLADAERSVSLRVRCAASSGTAATLASGKIERRHSVDSRRSARNYALRDSTVVWDGRVTCESRCCRPVRFLSPLCAGLRGNASVVRGGGREFAIDLRLLCLRVRTV